MNRFFKGQPLLTAGLLLAAPALAQDELADAPSRTKRTSPVMSFANGSNATVIFTNFLGAPAANVPGLPGVVFDPGTTSTADFDRVYGSPNGNWILTAFADLPFAEDELVLVNGAVVVQEGFAAPWNPLENAGFTDTKCGINDSGDFVFVNNTDGDVNLDDYVVTNIGGTWGIAAREGDPIPFLAGNNFDDLSSPAILANGDTGFESNVEGTVLSTEDDFMILANTVLLQEEVTVPPGQAGMLAVDIFDTNDFFASLDGAHWLVQGDFTGTVDDDFLIVDGAVVLQEGVVIPGSGFANPIASAGIGGCFMDGAGNWYARGDNDVSGLDWVVRNGSVIATTGDPAIAGGTELWDDTDFSNCFFLHVGNTNGDYVVGGVTDAPSDQNGLLVLNGEQVVCREGDPVDIDGNGAFDDDVFIRTFGNDDAHLTDDGVFYMVVTLQDGAGNGVGQAFISIDLDTSLGTNYCAAVPNTTGGIATITASGSTTAADNDLTLTASGMPLTQFGLFVTSQTQAATPVASGLLCVGGTIIRFQEPGQIQTVDANGEFSLQIDTTALPGLLPTPILPGETWNFQAWYRDTDPVIGNTANFSDAVEITFN